MGIGLLVAGRLGRERRRAVGITLVAIGGLSTIPLALEVLGKRRVRATDHERSVMPPAMDFERDDAGEVVTRH